MRARRFLLSFCLLTFGLSFVWACAFDTSLREYLHAQFWLPFAKSGRHFEKRGVRRSSAPYAGMQKADGGTSLARVRAAYQHHSEHESWPAHAASVRQALAVALSDKSLKPQEREEVELVDAKIDMWDGEPDGRKSLEKARKKYEEFLRKARSPEYRSEARGWLAHIHYLFGEQTAAGKIYLDELNRNDSNLSRETLLISLEMTYGYDGGPKLLEHLDEYFDTPEHAAFAIHLVTNPWWDSSDPLYAPQQDPVVTSPPPYARIKSLLERHSSLFRAERGASTLALLGMRTALRAGDPPAALRIAEKVPAQAAVRGEPDFQWMLASVLFLSRDYAAAEEPLMRLFQSSRSSLYQKAAAAYGLCGAYQKAGNPVEQIHFALWLHAESRRNQERIDYPGEIGSLSVYWAQSGWDLGLLLDAEAPIEALRAFLDAYPNVPDVRLVRYGLAVRLARENQYEEAEQIYNAIGASRRAQRMRQLALLYRDANRTEAPAEELLEAKYKLAEFIAANQDRFYFNDTLWQGFQRYALYASKDSRLSRDERQRLMAVERKLKDDQEEQWRAYLILKEVVLQSGKTDLGRRAAQLAVRCLRRISERFERGSQIRAADVELSTWLRHSFPPAFPGR